jgi:hypothetical protein
MSFGAFLKEFSVHSTITRAFLRDSVDAESFSNVQSLMDLNIYFKQRNVSKGAQKRARWLWAEYQLSRFRPKQSG